jgi:hypothetical protein
MSVDEFLEWAVYAELQHERQKQAMKKHGANPARNPPHRKR